MAIKKKTGLFAIGITVAAFLFIIVAFCTPYWLQNDEKIENPQFIRIGLWEACFVNFEDFRHQYDYRFTGCWWVFEEEYYIIHDFLLPGFFIATQFFFTLCTTLLLVGLCLTWMYCFCSRDHDKYILLLLSNGSNLILSGVFGIIACLIFGINGDRRDWMPNWQHNSLGFSFAFACIGSLLLFPAGTLFIIEARKANYRRLASSQPPSQYNIEMPKSTHTDI